MVEKSTSFHTISRLLLRELRQERSVQQAQISQLLGRASTSSWSKVEAGDTPLTLEHITTACSVFQIWPSDLFQAVQSYVMLMTQNGWYVAVYGSPLSKDDDQLSVDANAYYAFIASKAHIPTWRRFPVLQTPWPYPGSYEPLDVFRWVLDPTWKEQVLAPPISILGVL